MKTISPAHCQRHNRRAAEERQKHNCTEYLRYRRSFSGCGNSIIIRCLNPARTWLTCWLFRCTVTFVRQYGNRRRQDCEIKTRGCIVIVFAVVAAWASVGIAPIICGTVIAFGAFGPFRTFASLGALSPLRAFSPLVPFRATWACLALLAAQFALIIIIGIVGGNLIGISALG